MDFKENRDAEGRLLANVMEIVRGTTVDGPGFRTSVYFAGCSHHCPGCHNPNTWAYDAGTPMTVSDIMEVVEEEDFDVTFTGGDPLYRPEFVTELARTVRATGHSIWIYTGFVWEDIKDRDDLRGLWGLVECVVEGPFVEALKDSDLPFRGSSNQRLIRLPK